MSKLKLLSSVAVAALIAMPAFAQTSPSAPASRPSTTAPDSAASKSTLPSDIHAAKVSELVGKNVYNTNNEKVGDINEIVVPKSGSRQAMAVIGVGGFLGIGEKEAAVPLDQLKVQNDKIVAAGLTKEQLKQHADYKKEKDNYTKLDRNQVVGQASGTTGTSTRTAPSGSSTTVPSTTGSSSTGTSGSSSTGSSSTTPSGSMNSGSTTGSGSSGSGSATGSSDSSSSMGSTGSSSAGSPNPAATSNPPDNSTATKKQ